MSLKPPRDDSVQWILEVEKKEIAYLVGIFDAYDNLAVVRTIDPVKAHVELMIAPDFVEDVDHLLKNLGKEIKIEKISPDPV